MKRPSFILSFFIVLICFSCSNQDNKINLKWNPSIENDSIENALIGLRWSLSTISASTSLEKELYFVKDSLITIKIDDLGFNSNTYKAIIKLNKKIFESEGYRKNQSIDLGRYITLLIGSSAHYYTFTGVPKHIDEILKNYEFRKNKGRINNSQVSFENRIISYSGQKGLNQLFLSTETDSASGKIIEFESIEIMNNGQLRFGVFDINGVRKDFGDPEHTKAGKPAKCMWCHESKIAPLFTSQINFEGYLSAIELKDTLSYFSSSLKEKQNILKTTVDYRKRQNHTQMELLYISFMEPSALRLSKEWCLSIEDVKKRLKGLEVHVHKEFPQLGKLYNRADVDPFAPYKSLTVSSSVREPSNIEVNYLD